MTAVTGKAGLAAFDFDGTMTYVDSFAVFLWYSVGSLRLLWGAVRLSPTLIGRLLGRVSRAVAKERVLIYFFAGVPEQELKAKAQRFASNCLPKILRSSALDRLKWHLQEGHQCIMVSASPEIYLQFWGKAHGFHQVLATRIQVSDGIITGRLAGANCRGSEKVHRLSQLLGDLDRYCIYAYGDSRGDREMLAAADHSYYRQMPKPGVV